MKLLPKIKKKIKKTKIVKQQEKKDFIPNPGGQETLFDYIPLDKPYEDKIRWFYLRGGVGAGKSRAGSAFVVSRSQLYPTVRGLITAQSFPQLRDSTLVALAEYCFEYGYKISPSGGSANDTARKIAYKQICKINGVDILVKSIEAFTGISEKSKESGRGVEVGWCWYDEGAYGQGQAFDTLNTRLRWNLPDYLCHGLITSSINKNNPYNWIYDYFDADDRNEKLKEIHHTIICSTIENIQGDPNYVKALKASLTDELIKIELKGEYARVMEGVIFSYFEREKHCLDNYQIDERYPIHVSLDFNHHPSCAIASQFLEHSQEIIVLREWYLEHSDTFKLSEAIAKWFLEIRGNRVRGNINTWLEWNCYELQIHGDASGNQKTANSKKTNWQIVKSTFDNLEIEYQTHYKKANPSIKDTINSVNCAFKGEKLWIDRKCKELIKDLESLKWDLDGGIDKKDIRRSHEGDCLRYLVEDILPYNKLISGARETRLNYKPTGVIF